MFARFLRSFIENNNVLAVAYYKALAAAGKTRRKE